MQTLLEWNRTCKVKVKKKGVKGETGKREKEKEELLLFLFPFPFYPFPLLPLLLFWLIHLSVRVERAFV
jgi:hypothetical protein